MPGIQAEPPRTFPCFAIPTTSKAAAIEFVLDKARAAMAGQICFLMHFSSADAQQLNLCNLWPDIEQRLAEPRWKSKILLSCLSPDSLVLNCVRQHQHQLKASMLRVIGKAISEAGMDDVLSVKQNFSSVQKNGDGTYVADIATVDSDDNPLVWYEISDGECYHLLLDKLMLVRSLHPTIVNFVLVYIPSKSNRLHDEDMLFLLDFQVFDRLTDMLQLGDDGFCTLGRGSDHHGFSFPRSGERKVEHNFDLFLGNRHKLDFEPYSGPIEVPTEPIIMPIQISAHGVDTTLNIDLIPVWKEMQYLALPRDMRDMRFVVSNGVGAFVMGDFFLSSRQTFRIQL